MTHLDFIIHHNQVQGPHAMALQDPSTLECASRRRCIEKVEAPYYSPIKEYACGHRLVLFLNQK